MSSAADTPGQPGTPLFDFVERSMVDRAVIDLYQQGAGPRLHCEEPPHTIVYCVDVLRAQMSQEAVAQVLGRLAHSNVAGFLLSVRVGNTGVVDSTYPTSFYGYTPRINPKSRGAWLANAPSDPNYVAVGDDLTWPSGDASETGRDLRVVARPIRRERQRRAKLRQLMDPTTFPDNRTILAVEAAVPGEEFGYYVNDMLGGALLKLWSAEAFAAANQQLENRKLRRLSKGLARK